MEGKRFTEDSCCKNDVYPLTFLIYDLLSFAVDSFPHCRCSLQEQSLDDVWNGELSSNFSTTLSTLTLRVFHRTFIYEKLNLVTNNSLSHQLPMPVSPSGVSGISAFPFWTCRGAYEANFRFISFFCAPPVATKKKIPLKNPFCGFFKIFQ